ncbi:MAG: DsrH/TusB family sulfur metabolism protein [Xanthomonadales bacterium]|nr:DsrH/TusB family sulfur metabolism protein [Xanthomonadales bacterium]
MKAPGDRTCLHLVVEPHQAVLASCASYCSPGDLVFFLANGVFALTDDHLVLFDPRGQRLLFSVEDIGARGLQSLAQHRAVELADDDGLAALISQCDHCLTWK